MIEIVVVIGILALLSAGAFFSLRTLGGNKILETEALKVVSELQKARSFTLASRNADQYGVRFASSSMDLFRGAVYAATSSENVTTQLNSAVVISAIELAGGGSSVVFDRLSGNTSQSGTTTLSLTADSSVIKSVVVYPTGLVEVQ